jgi:leader peptidase (prepilin peptidase)/N-methyltransferase
LILGPVLAGAASQLPAPSLGVYGGLLWLVYFGVVAVIDLEHRLILHPVSIAGAVLGLVFGWIYRGFPVTITGGAAGFGFMLIFYFLGDLFVRFLARQRGEEIEEVALGFGDVNLSGVIGLLLGWPGVVAGLFLAILIGGVVSGFFLLIQMARKKYQAFQALPYGPFIVLSALFLLFFSRFLG